MKALLLIDIQNDYFPKGRLPLRGIKKAARNAASLLEDFRRQDLPVIHIKHHSLSPTAGYFRPGTPGADIHPIVVPKDGEKVITKNFPNSFRSTDLDEHLKDLGVTELHIAGAMTNMCVDSSTRAGFDLGYRIYLHQKACAAKGFLGTELIHRISVKTLGHVFARIV